MAKKRAPRKAGKRPAKPVKKSAKKLPKGVKKGSDGRFASMAKGPGENPGPRDSRRPSYVPKQVKG